MGLQIDQNKDEYPERWMNLPKKHGSKYKAKQIQGGPENHHLFANVKVLCGLLRGCAEDGWGESGCSVQEGQRYSDEPFAAEWKVEWALRIVGSIPINKRIVGRRGLLGGNDDIRLFRIRHMHWIKQDLAVVPRMCGLMLIIDPARKLWRVDFDAEDLLQHVERAVNER
jgi:hypothetical protein